LHESSRACVAQFVETHLTSRQGTALRILGIGSPSNGDDFADLFDHEGWQFVNLDVQSDHSVDSEPDHSFDVIVCGEALTLLARPWEAITEWARLLVDDGLLCVVAPGAGPEHDGRGDHFRFLPDGLAALVRSAGLAPVEIAQAASTGWHDDSAVSADSMVIAVKAEPAERLGSRTVVAAPTADTPDASGFEKAASVWSTSTQVRSGESYEAEHARRTEWTYHPLVAARLDERGGGPFFEWVARAIGNPDAKLVSIGCGAAAFEVDLLIHKVVGSLVLVDIADGSLDQARAKAAAAGVIDRITFASTPITASTIGMYLEGVDVVFATDSLHHIAHVGDVITVIHDAMRPGTRFIARDYVGPNRFAFEPEVLEVARSTYRALSDTVRSPWPDLSVPDPVEVERFDPTEAIDSEAIIPSLRALFSDCEIIPIGGALSHVIWYSLDHDAVFETEEGRRAVGEVMDQEDQLMAAGRLPSYFVRFIATR